MRKPKNIMDFIFLSLIIILVLVLLGVAIYLVGGLFIDKPTSIITSANQKLVKTQQKTISELTNELSEYKVQEEEERLRIERIKALHRPEIVEEGLEEIFEIGVIKKTGIYSDVIPKKHWLKRDNELSMAISYTAKFGLSKGEEIEEFFNEDRLTLAIPSENITLLGLETSLKSDEKNKFFTMSFTTKELNSFYNLGRIELKNKLLNDREVYEFTCEQVEKRLVNVFKNRGYSEVIVRFEK